MLAIMSVSIIIPVFNAAMSLEKLYKQLIPEMEAITNEFEIVMVEDRSADDSWKIIRKLQESDHRLRALRLSRNYGQHNA